MNDKRLFALRGAVCSLNTADDIKKQTILMYDELLAKNGLNEEDIVSLIFSVTVDLNAKNPATALREEGRAKEIALFVNQEAWFEGAMERVIRLLIHCYLDEDQVPVHVFRNGAEILRPDLSAV